MSFVSPPRRREPRRSLVRWIEDRDEATRKRALAVLVTMRQLLDHARPGFSYARRSGWTAGSLAKDDLGLGVSPYSKHAQQFCLVGGMYRAARDNASPFLARSMVRSAIRRGIRAQGKRPFMRRFNDVFGYAAVMNVLDEAIASVRDPNPIPIATG